MQKKVRSARFAILFLLTLAAMSAGVFFIFSTWQRKMAELRREKSTQNLSIMEMKIRGATWKNHGVYPDHATQVTQEIDDDSTLIQPAWPEQPGYIYITGVKAWDPADSTILIYENVPERKRKLGIQVLLLNLKIETLTEREFVEKLNAQEIAWKISNRVWNPEALVRGAK